MDGLPAYLGYAIRFSGPVTTRDPLLRKSLCPYETITRRLP
jgi:hypothetical protein